MNYGRLLDYIQSYIGRYQASNIGDYEYFTYAREYLYNCEKLMRKHLWLWNLTYLDTSPDSDGFITLPYKSANYPVLIEDEQSNDGGIPVEGVTRHYNAYVRNTSGTSNSLEKYIPHMFTTSADYTGTVDSYVVATKVVTQSAGDTNFTVDDLIGKAVKFDGQETWYTITDNDATTFTLDRTYAELGDPDSSQTPATDSLAYYIEPEGCPRLYFPDGTGSIRIWYPLRFQPAVTESDDCGWDSRLDSIMPRLIAGSILISTSGDSEIRQNGHIMYQDSMKELNQVWTNLENPGSVEHLKFVNPQSPFGAGTDYSAEGILKGRRYHGSNYQNRFRW